MTTSPMTATATHDIALEIDLQFTVETVATALDLDPAAGEPVTFAREFVNGRWVRVPTQTRRGQKIASDCSESQFEAVVAARDRLPNARDFVVIHDEDGGVWIAH